MIDSPGNEEALQARIARRFLRVPTSVRTRMVWWFVLLLAAATLGSVLVVRQVLIQRLDARVDAELSQEVAEIRLLADGIDPATGQPFGPRVARIFEVFLDRNVPARSEVMLTFVGGGLEQERMAAQVPFRASEDPVLVERWASVTATDRGRVQTTAGTLEYLAVPFLSGGEPVGVFVVGIFRDLEAADTDAATIAAGVVGLVAVLFGSLLALRLAERILAPVRALTLTARAIRETDLTRRIPAGGNDEIAELAATFNDMLDRLQSAFAAQRQFVDDAGHQLRTPIAIIQGHLEVMSDSAEDRQATLALVHDELDRTRRLVDDLLKLARAEQPDFVRARDTDIRALTELVFEKATALGERAWLLEAVADVTVALDSQRLTEAILQFAENAVQHTTEGDVVALGSAVTPTELRFWVRDEGVGIAIDQQALVFERFYRAPDSRRRAEGSGLGLAIVRAIAEAHGGRVELRSAPGAGATFTIVLPFRRPVAAG